MTDLIALAKQAGISPLLTTTGPVYLGELTHLQAFADLIRKDEREQWPTFKVQAMVRAIVLTESEQGQ